MALREWESGAHIPFGQGLTMSRIFHDQCEVMSAELLKFMLRFPVAWKKFADDVRAFGLMGTENVGRSVDAPGLSLDWGFSW